jgi:hypothetical protein
MSIKRQAFKLDFGRNLLAKGVPVLVVDCSSTDVDEDIGQN